MFGMGHYEIIIILVVILLVFGAKRIPEMAQGLGKGIKEFRKAMKDVKDEVDISEHLPSDTIGAAPAPDHVAQRVSPPPASPAPPQVPTPGNTESGSNREESGNEKKEASQG